MTGFLELPAQGWDTRETSSGREAEARCARPRAAARHPRSGLSRRDRPRPREPPGCQAPRLPRWLAAARGEQVDALDLARRAVDLVAGTDSIQAAASAHEVLADILEMRGDVEEARQQLQPRHLVSIQRSATSRVSRGWDCASPVPTRDPASVDGAGRGTVHCHQSTRSTSLPRTWRVACRARASPACASGSVWMGILRLPSGEVRQLTHAGERCLHQVDGERKAGKSLVGAHGDRAHHAPARPDERRERRQRRGIVGSCR